MANLIRCGDFSCDDSMWSFGTGWSRNVTTEELEANSSAQYNTTIASEWDIISIGQTIYYSIDVLELSIDDPANWDTFKVGGVDVPPPTTTGTISGQVTATSNENLISFRFDGIISAIRMDNIIVSDTPLSDTTPPNVTLPTATSITTTTVVLGATTDESNGTAHAIIVPNGEESAPTNQEVIDGAYSNTIAVASDVNISATGAFTFPAVTGLINGTTYGYIIVHEDSAGNEDAGSRVESSFTTDTFVATTYPQVLDSLGFNHRYSFDGNSQDSIGSANGTDTSITYTNAAICEDTTNCATTNSTTDRITLPDIADINGAVTRKIVSGWFQVSKIQQPPVRIYGEGNATQSISFILGFGNGIVFEVDDPSFTLQIYGDTPLVADRPYHLTMIFQGNGYANEFKAYLDGIKQLDSANVIPNSAQLTARTVGEFADPAGTVAMGGTAIVLVAPVNGKYNQWCFGLDAAADISDIDIRTKLFEKGAIPDIIISSDTQVNMQNALDAIANTVRPNVPLCIRIEDVSGGGNLTLDADNITFDPLASIHIQWMGEGILTWRNLNGSNASISSSIYNGLVQIENPATLTINGIIDGAEVRIYDNEDSDPLFFGTELAGTEYNSGTSFTYQHSGAVNDVIIQMLAPGYVEVLETVSLGPQNTTITLHPEQETN